MTDHPITRPPKLLDKWLAEWAANDEVTGPQVEYVATQASRWGADQELEACCEWLGQNCGRWELPAALRAARRPKPQSLKEQALETLRSMQIKPVIIDGLNVNKDVMEKYDIIRRALEQLDD